MYGQISLYSHTLLSQGIRAGVLAYNGNARSIGKAASDVVGDAVGAGAAAIRAATCTAHRAVAAGCRGESLAAGGIASQTAHALTAIAALATLACTTVTADCADCSVTGRCAAIGSTS